MNIEPTREDGVPARSHVSERPRIELARRHASGITVRLLWSRETNVRTVSVVDPHGRSFDLVLSPDDRALDAFYHPYAYAAMRGLTPEQPRSDEEPARQGSGLVCATCAEGPKADCSFCHLLRIEVSNGFAALHLYLSNWAKFAAWERAQG